ncbi:MAG: 6-carboxytetrahydropterin synthase [Desulfurococcales archaeon]|nr:6-carboxytetrahydropterin synthase [Desulfurococcales archaeon]
MGEAWIYCARGIISTALKIESMGYHIHGHDINLEACVCSTKPRALDLVSLRKSLEEVLSKYDHKPLWETLGLEDAVMEDLVEAVRNELEEALKLKGMGAHVCIIKASVPGESVEYRSGARAL